MISLLSKHSANTFCVSSRFQNYQSRLRTLQQRNIIMQANCMRPMGNGQRVLTSSRPSRGSLKVACTATLEPTVSVWPKFRPIDVNVVCLCSCRCLVACSMDVGVIPSCHLAATATAALSHACCRRNSSNIAVITSTTASWPTYAHTCPTITDQDRRHPNQWAEAFV